MLNGWLHYKKPSAPPPPCHQKKEPFIVKNLYYVGDIMSKRKYGFFQEPKLSAKS